MNTLFICFFLVYKKMTAVFDENITFFCTMLAICIYIALYWHRNYFLEQPIPIYTTAGGRKNLWGKPCSVVWSYNNIIQYYSSTDM